MTVREAFSLAYGPVPEGATCHVGVEYPYEGITFWPTYSPAEGRPMSAFGGPGWDDVSGDPVNPDISDRPASSFLGFFGDAYDKVVKETPDA